MQKKCHFEKLLIDYLANELPGDQRDQMRAHLKTCPKCALQHRELRLVHGYLTHRKRPMPAAELLQSYQIALKTAFKSQILKGSVGQRLLHFADVFFNAPSLYLRLAKGLAILFIGIFLGRIMFNPLDSRQVSESAPMALLPINQVDSYLPYTFWENTEILLLQILNSDLTQESDPETFLICRELANKLIAQSLLANDMAAARQNERLSLFITRLEMLVYELANASDQEGISSLHQIRRFIIESDLLSEFRKLKEFTLIYQQNI